MIEHPDISIISDNVVLVSYPEVIDERINALVMDLCENIRALQKTDQAIKGIIDVVPTYHTLQIVYDALVCDPEALVNDLRKLVRTHKSDLKHGKKVVEIPVCYEAPFAPDMDLVCKHHNISRTELIRKHTGRRYLIYMMGFTPGFPYFGGMVESIAMQRKEKPRLKIPAGSVGIAGEQTGIYPVESPGGWQIIGRTPYRLFDPQAEKPFLLEAGQFIEFYPISLETYERLRQQQRLKQSSKSTCVGD